MSASKCYCNSNNLNSVTHLVSLKVMMYLFAEVLSASYCLPMNTLQPVKCLRKHATKPCDKPDGSVTLYVLSLLTLPHPRPIECEISLRFLLPLLLLLLLLLPPPLPFFLLLFPLFSRRAHAAPTPRGACAMAKVSQAVSLTQGGWTGGRIDGPFSPSPPSAPPPPESPNFF